MKEHNYIFYGHKANSQEVKQFIEHLMQQNLQAELLGKNKSPICIWGTHGIGKTEIVQQIASEKNYRWAYIAAAQFEEMGDLIGMPSIKDGKTVFNPPHWVPTEEGPGILLIDDINRADDRILRGMMQLLQRYELLSWKLPKAWQIVLTANPEGGDYSLSPLDDAMLTRMLHISLEFDAKSWAIWAERNQVDPRGINFVLQHPNLVQGERTTPRTLVQFFQNIASIPNLSDDLSLVQMLAASCLDEATVAAFINFVQQGLSELISPEEICHTLKFEQTVAAPLAKLVQQDLHRVDILATLCTRLKNYLIVNNIKTTADQLKNIRQFILMDILPNDLRLSFLQDLVSSTNGSLKNIVDDPAIAQLLLQKM